jgi:hypothetical protein
MSPPNKTQHIVSFLRESKISKFTNIMSNEEVVKELLGNSKHEKSKELLKVPDATKAIADVLQSITTEAMTINELMSMLYNTYDIATLNGIASFLTIIHGEDGNYVGDDTIAAPHKNRFWGNSHFSAKKIKPKPVDSNSKKLSYKHNATYGLLGSKNLEINQFGARTVTADSRHSQQSAGPVYNIEEICHAKASNVSKNSRKGEKPSDNNLINATEYNSNRIAATKTKPSLAYILVDQPDLRIGTRNSLELATFFNLLSTVELSKCQPYLNAVFVLPNLTESKNSSKVFKTASITQFFDGTPISDDVTTSTYKSLEASFKRTVGSGQNKVVQDAVDTNMSAFTMPQTINNFNEAFIGHNENVVFNTDMQFTRSTTVHDITRPFLTIKSFNIDVAPTQGLMSFKTGKLSLILHDRTRMVDIAPFIKPDLFGSFGAEIAIEYGWSHLDSEIKNSNTKHSNVRNYLGEFLNASRVTEKYIITNSSFSMDNTGQVNIELSIAMRGPVDIRSVKLHSDPVKGIKTAAITTAERSARDAIEKINAEGYFSILSSTAAGSTTTKLTLNENIFNAISNEINRVTDVKTATFPMLSKIVGDKGSKLNAFSRSINKASAPHDYINAFKALDKTKIKKTETNHRVLGHRSLLYFEGIDNDGTLKSYPDISPFKVSTYKSPTADESSANIMLITSKNKATARKALFKSIVSYITLAKKSYIDEKAKLKAAENLLISKIMGGLDKVDPFYNTHWLEEYYRIIEGEKDVGKNGVPILGIDTESGPTSYVTLGSFLTGLIGTHLSCTGKFDEIQIVSYTCNEFAGLMSNLNVSSLLLPKKELKKFLGELFADGTTFTLEGIISQVINRYISTRMNICYGLKSLYNRDKTGGVNARYKSASMQTKKVNDMLRKIYYLQAKPNMNADQIVTPISLDDVRFVMPKIKLTFDTVTSKKSGYDLTISRISIFDQNDNPFGSINTIMKDTYDKGIITVAAQLNRLRKDYMSKATTTTTKKVRVAPAPATLEEKATTDYTTAMKTTRETADLSSEEGLQRYRDQAIAMTFKHHSMKVEEITRQMLDDPRTQDAATTALFASGEFKDDPVYRTVKVRKLKMSKQKFFKKSWSYVQNLVNSGHLREVAPGIYEINNQFKLSTLKASFKRIMPSLTYGTQNSAIIEASVSTVNEAKLNTVYLTRSDRANDKKNKIAAKVAFAKDLPLRVLPTQATVTMFGCPFVNFAQYIFLDFETGTTIDNSYAITGIKHDLTPGKFTTQLTLSYGDVYGKYENAAQTIARTIDDIVKPKQIESAEASAGEIAILAYGEKPKDIEIGSNRVFGRDMTHSFKVNGATEFTFLINIIPTFTTGVWFVKESKDKNVYKMYIAINAKISNAEELDNPKALNKTINVDLDLLRNKKIFDSIAEAQLNHIEAFYYQIILPEKIDEFQNKFMLWHTGIRDISSITSLKVSEKKLFNDKQYIQNLLIKDANQQVKQLASQSDKTKFQVFMTIVKDAIKEKLVTLKFKLKFDYKGMEANYSDQNINPSVEFDWNLFDPVANHKFFSKHYKEELFYGLTVSDEYRAFIDSLIWTGNIKVINNITNVSNKGKNGNIFGKRNDDYTIKKYLKNNKAELTIAGLEFEVISGHGPITTTKKPEKKGKKKKVTIIKSAAFVYTKVLLSWSVLFNNFYDIQGNFAVVPN